MKNIFLFILLGLTILILYKTKEGLQDSTEPIHITDNIINSMKNFLKQNTSDSTDYTIEVKSDIDYFNNATNIIYKINKLPLL